MTVFTHDNTDKQAKLLVMGVGGGGGNAVAHMIEEGTVQGVEFVCANTDAQAAKQAVDATNAKFQTDAAAVRRKAT